MYNKGTRSVVSSRRIPDVQNDAGHTSFFIDESIDQNVFVVEGIIVNNENDVNKKHKRYKNEDNPASTIQN